MEQAVDEKEKLSIKFDAAFSFFGALWTQYALNSIDRLIERINFFATYHHTAPQWIIPFSDISTTLSLRFLALLLSLSFFTFILIHFYVLKISKNTKNPVLFYTVILSLLFALCVMAPRIDNMMGANPQKISI